MEIEEENMHVEHGSWKWPTGGFASKHFDIRWMKGNIIKVRLKLRAEYKCSCFDWVISTGRAFRLNNWLTGWPLSDCLTDCLTDSLTHWLTHWLAHWLTDERTVRLIDGLTDWQTVCMYVWQANGLTDRLTNLWWEWLTDGQTDGLNDWLANWLTGGRTNVRTDWRTDWLFYLLIEFNWSQQTIDKREEQINVTRNTDHVKARILACWPFLLRRVRTYLLISVYYFVKCTHSR